MRFKTLFLGFFLALVLPTQALAATLELSPATGTFNKGCSYNVDINLDTAGENIDGTDALIKYDPSKFNIGSITPGGIFPDYPASSADTGKGLISISGIASANSPFKGAGKLATINLTVSQTAVANSTVSLDFDYDPNDKAKTTDTNVVQTGTVADILDSVTSGTYNISTGACTGNGSVKKPVGGIVTPKGGVSSQSATIDDFTGAGTTPGSINQTVLLSVVGGLLVIFGIAGLALL